MLIQAADRYGSRAAFLRKKDIHSPYEPVSFRQYREDVFSLGAALLAHGFAGQHIAVIGENRYEWIMSFLAVCSGLGVIVPLDKELPAHEIAALVDRGEVSAVIYSDRLRTKVVEALVASTRKPQLICMDAEEDPDHDLTIPALLQEGCALRENGHHEYEALPIDETAMSILVFTSGTTGLAKGVMLSHKNFCHNVTATVANVPLEAMNCEPVGLSLLPMHHTYELSANVLGSLHQGGTLAFCDGLKYITKNMAEAKVSYMIAVPLIYESMYRRLWKTAEKEGKAKKMRSAIKLVNSLSHIDPRIRKKTAKLFRAVYEALGGHICLLIAGAAAIDPQVASDFMAMGLTVTPGYGMTEHAPIITVNPYNAAKPASAGTAIPGVEIRIEDKDENGIGEIVVRSDSVMLGYYNDPEETAKVLSPDGWLRTGDYGYMDADGYLYITGRKKNVIVTKNGKNIFPEEVEYYLCKSPFILECVVRGVEDEKSGDLVVTAEIYPDQEKLAELGRLSDQELNELFHSEIGKCNDMMPSYKWVRRFDLREEPFEKTTTQKIKRW